MGAVPAHVVFTHDKNKGKLHYDMAIEFARHLSSAEGTCRFAADLYEVPARQSGIDYCYDNGILSRDDLNLQFFASYFDRAPVVRVVLDPDLSALVSKFQADVLYPNYEAALLGTLSAEEAFDRMVEGSAMLKKK
jgi:ABC-type glycerol-3-phosphate transport system substrate-binding protein